jgi:RNA polymerase sigma-70 factor (ECF subfamily)
MIEKQFLELINQNQGILIKVCKMYCSDTEMRRDLYQEIVLQLWRAFPNFKAEAKVSTWIYQIALNTAITDYRRSKKQGQKIELNEVFFEIPDHETNTDYQQQIQWLNKAITTFTDPEKAILILFLEEKSHDKISEIVGISNGNLRVKLYRIQEKLKKLKTQTAIWN